jgi:hypothetical protein
MRRFGISELVWRNVVKYILEVNLTSSGGIFRTFDDYEDAVAYIREQHRYWNNRPWRLYEARGIASRLEAL